MWPVLFTSVVLDSELMSRRKKNSGLLRIGQEGLGVGRRIPQGGMSRSLMRFINHPLELVLVGVSLD